MGFPEIIEDIQTCILSLQTRLDQLRAMDNTTAQDVFLTRQEAADMIGKSLRQLDRDCVRFRIRKRQINGGIRISKADLLRHMGLLGSVVEEESEGESAFDRIYNSYRR